MGQVQAESGRGLLLRNACRTSVQGGRDKMPAYEEDVKDTTKVGCNTRVVKADLIECVVYNIVSGPNLYFV